MVALPVTGTIADASAGTLTCNLVIMKKLRSGKIVDINVILDHPKKVDMTM